MQSWYRKVEATTFLADFCTRKFLVRGKPLCHHSTGSCIVSESLWYNQVSFVVTNRDRISIRSPRKFPNIAQATGNVDVLFGDLVFWNPLRGELPHVQIFLNDRPKTLTWEDQLPSYWFRQIWWYSKISSLISSIITGLVKILGLPGRGAT